MAIGLSAAVLLDAGTIAVQAQAQTPAQPAQAVSCRLNGRITSGTIPLPGVSLVAHLGDALKAATSTDLGGAYSLLLAPNATYHLSGDFAGFSGIDRDVTIAAPPCDQTVDLQLALQARAGTTARPSAQAGPRFQTLEVQSAAGDPAVAAATPVAEAEDVSKLLPPGFSLETAQADVVAIAGNSDATNVDRGLMNDRGQLINLGQLDPATGQFAQGFAPAPGGPAGGFGGGPGGPGGGGGPGGRGGGAGGRGGFALGGRNQRGQSAYQGSATYTFGGSMLDSPPYQLRQDVPINQPSFAQNSFGGTLGGPLKIPGLYADANRRTNFQLNYTGNQSNNLFDQYATVPTLAERNGDFSASPVALIDPSTGQAFAGNQIPADRFAPAAATLMSFIPTPNLPGSQQNFHVSTTAHTSSESFSLRVTQNLSPAGAQPPDAAGGRGGAGAGRFGAGGGRGGGGGPRGGLAAARGTNVMLTGQLQYRRTNTEALNIFPDLGSSTTSTSLSAPISLNVRHGRSLQNFTLNLTHATTETSNGFENTDNVAGLAGIQYPGGASADPINWGVPNLTFSSGLTGVRSAAASSRADDRLAGGYAWIHPSTKHLVRIGGDYRLDRSAAAINANARGSFIFTGLYTSAGTPAPGADFADFLLGLPQQATLQVGGTTFLRQHSLDGYVEDNWQKNAKLTLNLGLRYELARPYTEINGHMANLDATPDLTAVAPVLPGGIGLYTGSFPAGLLKTDANNLGPRLGFAYRVQPGTILRGGYGITYNSGSYASIAQALSGQPPFADTETVTGGDDAPLTLAEALLSTPTTATTNNWGVDKDYALGMIQTWNATVTRNLTQNLFVQAGYTGIKGSDLDILRAPSLGAGGALIAGTQGFIWESSGARSIMNGANLQVRRRLANGFGGGVSYTLARAKDNASSLGAGGPVVAQNDQDLAAEWAPSNFDRRQQLNATAYLELPFGPNRRWLSNGGTVAALFGEWSAQFNLTLQSGTPLTARVLGAATDLLRGVNGSLRANYSGAPISLTDPTVDEFFNATAFSVPSPGTFGDSSRNAIVGPGGRQLNALFQRDIRLGGTKALTLQVNAINLLNTVQWAAVDTNVNSSTFGQVLSARPMRTMTVTARVRF